MAEKRPEDEQLVAHWGEIVRACLELLDNVLLSPPAAQLGSQHLARFSHECHVPSASINHVLNSLAAKQLAAVPWQAAHAPLAFSLWPAAGAPIRSRPNSA
jgi:hypothetical protein